VRRCQALMFLVRVSISSTRYYWEPADCTSAALQAGFRHTPLADPS